MMWTPEWIVEPRADLHVVADRGEGMDVDVVGQLGGGADGGQRADADAAAGGAAGGSGQSPGRRPGGRRPPGSRATPLGVNAAGRSTAAARQAARLRLLLLAVDQRDLARLGVAQRRGPVNHQVARAEQPSLDQRRQLGKSRLHDWESFP